ncbi:MAG: tetratricopeptide repeat protein [Spirochaetales bacterium]|nr:tetratricopeptide repeat protein [Spirochaetales bacterium]
MLLLFNCSTNKEPIKETTYNDKIDYIMTQYLLNNSQCVISEIDAIENASPEQRAILDYVKGLSYFKLGLYHAAVNSFLAAEKNIPMKQELYNNIGICYYYLGDYENALRYLHEAFLFDPAYKIAVDNYNLVASEDRTDESFLEIPLQAFSDNCSIYLCAGWMNYYLDRFPDAVYYFKKAIEIAPDYVMGYMALGFLYDTAKNYASALEYYRQAIELDSLYPDLWNNIGITYSHLSMPDKSKESFLKAIELNKDYPHPYNNLGFLYLHEDINKSIYYFERALAKNNYYPELLAESCGGLALALYFQGSLQKAHELKQTALEHNYKMSEIIYLKEYLHWPDDFINIFMEQIE